MKKLLHLLLPAIFVTAASPIATAAETTKHYAMSVSEYYYAYVMDDSGIAADIVFDNNDVYIKSPLTALRTYDAYIKGSVDGNKITVTFPQQFITVDASNTTYYANRLKLNADNTESGLPVYTIDNSAPLTYTIHDDGSITSDWTDADVILGLTKNDEQEWDYYGNFAVTYTPVNDTVLSIDDMPGDFADKLQSNWMIFSDEKSASVRLAVYNGKIYLADICSYNPDALIVGDINGSTVTFASGQYVGIHPKEGYHLFFYGLNKHDYDENQNLYPPTDGVIFTYDADAGTLTDASCMLGTISAYRTTASNTVPYDRYTNASVKRVPDEISHIPSRPAILDYDPDEDFSALAFVINATNIDGWPLDTDKLSYRIYDNGTIFTFTPDVYVNLTAATTDLPWNENYYSVYGDTYICADANTTFGRYILFETTLTNPGVQSVYKDGDEEYASDIVYFDNTIVSGIDNTAAAKEIISTTYTDLTGRIITRPTTGLYLKTTTYSDGTQTTAKQVLR